MSENRCEFEQYCMVEENTICADAEHPEDCDTYELLVRVHNNAIEEAIERLIHNASRAFNRDRIEALRKPEGGG